MGKKEIGFRFKIFLVKDECINDEIKKESERSIPFQSKNIDNIMLYYRQSNMTVPKWYREFLKQNDSNTVFSSSVSAYFCKKLMIDNEKKKFVIAFGGGESGFNLEKFDEKFGLRIALNLADSFVNLRKNNISTTMSKTREQAVKGQSVSSFGIDFEKDMVEGVTVLPKENSISNSNITGAMSVSVAKNINIDQLDDLLKECYRISCLKDYEKEFPFINNITEIKQNKALIEQLNNIILDKFNTKDTSRVWLSVPEFIEWDDVTGYIFHWNRYESCENELTSENAYHFLETNKLKVESFSDFKKYKIISESATHQQDKAWSFEECLYAQIEYDGKQYVYNNKKYYEIKNDYVEEINNRFNQLPVESPLPDNTKVQPEADYIKEICADKTKILLDQKCIRINTPIEICDIFDKNSKAFIHIKKYASSSVLSHLFSQAYVSADLFADALCQRIMLNKMKEADDSFVDDSDKQIYSIIIAIMTVKALQANEHCELPFFSKLNLVSTIEKIRKLGFKSVKVMYIYSSAPLYRTEVSKNAKV